MALWPKGATTAPAAPGQKIDDEFNPSLTFNSPGLLAMANAGDDTGDSQFFVTAIDAAGSTTPIALANMPQSLNFNYSIFGQLVSGFDTFEKIMSTQVQLNSQSSGETSQPVNPITITSASLVDDAHDGVLSVFAPASFDGNSATITVTATNTDGISTQQQFTASAVTDTQVDPPFLGPIATQTTTFGTPDVFNLTSTDLEGAGVTYFVVDPTTGNAPTNATVTIDQSTGQVTVTPNAGFSRHHQSVSRGPFRDGQQRPFKFRHAAFHGHGATAADLGTGNGFDNHRRRKLASRSLRPTPRAPA